MLLYTSICAVIYAGLCIICDMLPIVNFWGAGCIHHVCIRRHPYAFICIRYASVCTRMPPYASFTPPDAKAQHTCYRKRYKNKQHDII